jgi:hypothetical protein
METLTIKAATQESARDFCAALADFETELAQDETGTFLVTVTFRGSNREIVSVLRALEGCVSQRGDPAVVGLGGETYTLHPTDGPPSDGKPERPIAGHEARPRLKSG